MAKKSNASSSVFYPPVSFYFKVEFSGIKNSTDSSFQEVSGMEASIKTEDIVEGGENRFTYKVPVSTDYSNLVLKRGLVAAKSDLITWVKTILGSDFSARITTKKITVKLLDEKGNPLRQWDFFEAYPVKWSVSNFNAENNEIAIESLEFAYQYFK
ncbi:MAG: phage tail protein [Bacteroidetes bacterium]|nr:MAG: phage tail protein [Bacteroidota bacterium]